MGIRNIPRSKLKKKSVKQLISRMSKIEDAHKKLIRKARQSSLSRWHLKRIEKTKRRLQFLKNEYKKTDQIMQEKG